MADIAAGDLTYTITKQRRDASSNSVNNLTVAFGDGALTYPSGGIPLTSGKLGCPNSIISLHITSPASADGLVYKYDQANNKIRIYRMAAHAHDLLLKDAAVADGATTRVNAGTNLLGAGTGSNITVAGAGANGGVQNSAQAALGEVASGSYAPAATTLYIEVVGY
jgi:hypothetical protein